MIRKHMKAAVLAVAGALLAAGCSTGAGASSGGSAGSGGGSGGAAAVPAMASDAQLRAHALGATKGKILAWVPVGMGVSLMDSWTIQLKKAAAAWGMTFEMKDPNWDPAAQVAAVQELINSNPKPAVLVVHNKDQSTLAKLIQQAQQEGIYVIEVNMTSNYKSDAYVGIDPIEYGYFAGQDVVAACSGGKSSGKIAVMMGDPTSSLTSAYMTGLKKGLAGHNDIQIVSVQYANWMQSTANKIAATVLQKNPDLCAYVGGWDTMDYGEATAVKSAGLAGKVKIFTVGGADIACKGVGEGLFTKVYNQDAPLQGQIMGVLAAELLQSGQKPGSSRVAIYVPLTVIDKANYNQPGLCYTSNEPFPGSQISPYPLVP